MLGVGIGIATLDLGTGDNPAASTFSIVAGIWYLLSGIISVFVGGYIAARMSGKTVPTTGALHGLTTWAFTTLLVLYLLTSTVGALVGGAFSGVASAVGGLGKTVAETAAPIIAESNPLDAIEAQVRATGTDPEALNVAAINAARKLMLSSEADAAPAREEAARALAAPVAFRLSRLRSSWRLSKSNTEMRSPRPRKRRRSRRCCGLGCVNGCLDSFCSTGLGRNRRLAGRTFGGGPSGLCRPDRSKSSGSVRSELR